MEVNGTNRDHFLVVVGWANWSTPVLWLGAAGVEGRPQSGLGAAVVADGDLAGLR